MPQLPRAGLNLGFFPPPFLPLSASQGKFGHLQVSLKHVVFLLLSEITVCLDTPPVVFPVLAARDAAGR